MSLNRNRHSLIIGCVALLLAMACASFVHAEPESNEIIQDQAGTQRIGLSNGVELVIVSTQEYAQSDVQVWLIVRAGSMYESDGQRGAAAVFERLIRSGTTNFSQTEIDELLAERDAQKDNRSSSFVSFDHAAYMGQVDKDDSAGIKRVLTFFGDVLNREAIVLDGDRVDEAIAGLIEEIENEPSADMRSRRDWLPELMHGSLFGDRLPRARIEELNRLTTEQIRSFGEAFYHPGQAMVIVVGDVDAKAIESQTAKAMGSINRGERDTEVDGRIKVDVSMRAVIDRDPGFEKNQGAMIWFRDRDLGPQVDGWSVRAGKYTHDDMRETVISRVSGEIIRHRLKQQSTQELGVQAELGVDQVDLFGQVDLLQIGIESSEKQWADSIEFLVRQCDRLSRDGATADEVSRARRSLLARWHRDADDWVGRENRERMGLVHWLITTGRPMIDMVRWDGLATELMTNINDDEIQHVLRGLINTKQASYIALEPGQDEGLRLDVLGVINQAMATPINPIDPKWMEQLAGSLIDSQPEGSEIEEIFQHVQSGVWSAKLSNGIGLWARTMNEDGSDRKDGRVHLTITLWGSVLSDWGIQEDEILAAMIAWREPATESRGHHAILAYQAEHDIKIRTRHEDGYVRLAIDAPMESVNQAMELAFVLLNRPMIERDAFAKWQDEHSNDEEDPIDQGLDALYTNKDHIRQSLNVTLDGAQRVLTQIVRNGRIDIGIAGSIDTEQVIKEGARLFGSLVDRESVSTRIVVDEQQLPVLRSERVIRVESQGEKECSVAVGYVGGLDRDLQSLRSLILTAMVLTDRMNLQAKDEGFEGYIRAGIWSSDALPDRNFLMVRVWCEQDAFQDAQRIVDDSIEAMVQSEIGSDELAYVQAKIVHSIERYFDTPGYWSVRMSMLGFNSRRVDDLWRIREGYSEIDAQYATRVFGELVGGNDRFRIEIINPADK